MFLPNLLQLVALLATTKGAAARRLGGPKYTDLTPMLSEVQNATGLVGVGAFVASADSLCAIGSAGNLWNAPDAPPIDLWNSPWHSGSLAKSMTSSLMALLVKDESVPLNWDTNLKQLFPVEAGNTAYANVTMAHLVSHRGGFPRDLPLEEEPPEGFLDLSLMEQRRAAMLYGFSTDPVVEPLVDGSYSNLGYIVAGAIMENVTGVAWEDLITERLFDKLGMTSAYFMCPNTTQAPLGHVYNNETGLAPIASTSWCNCLADYMMSCHCDLPAVYAPAGLVHMTLLDYVKYYQWHLAGHRGEDTSCLLSTEEFQRLHSSMGLIGVAVPGVDIELEYGYGWMIMDDPFGVAQGELLTHSGSNTLWYAEVFVTPVDDRVLFYATNSVVTKSGEPPWGLNTILINLIQAAMSNDTICTPMIQLDMNPDVEPHDECDELVYGDNTTVQENDTDLKMSSHGIDAWTKAAPITGPWLS